MTINPSIIYTTVQINLPSILRAAACLLFCSLFGESGAQQPAYFILGEQQFRGVHIYDIIQDNRKNYYFATRNGIYRYDFYNYTRMPCEGAKSPSVFNFVADHNGVIYCNNLNNQVFQIRDGVCRLFYELDKEDAHADISLSVSNRNELLIGARRLIVTDSNARVLVRYDKQDQYLGPPFTCPDGAIQYHIRGSDTILRYESGKFARFRLAVPTRQWFSQSILKFFGLGDRIYALDLRNKQTYRYDPDGRSLAPAAFNPVFNRSASVRIYETKNKLWVTGTLPGAMLLNPDLSSSETDTLYRNIFISDVYEDHEGNILLSTFNKGVLVIQDLNIPDVIHSFRDNPATALYSDPEMGLLIGTNHGSLIRYRDRSFDVIVNAGEHPIEGVYGSPVSDLILFDNGYIRSYNKKTRVLSDITEASLKEVAFISPAGFYLGTNVGVFKCVTDRNSCTALKINGLSQRVYSMAFDAENDRLYVATSIGLVCRDSSGAVKNIRHQGDEIFPTDLALLNGALYASTESNGILVIRHEAEIQVIRPLISGITESLEKILFYQNSIIGKTADGLYVFDMNGRLIRPLHSAFGFSDRSIIDFTVDQHTLWVSHSGGVQQLDLDYRHPARSTPPLLLESVFVNDRKLSPMSRPDFGSDERKIEFELLVPTLRHRQSLRYQYRLNGYDLNWNTAAQGSNRIVYSALAPGSYTLQAKAYINNVYTNRVAYPFIIAAPFYQNPWFLFFMALLFITVVYLIYRWKLKVQQHKSRQINELNASKLTAIQSQMNPHFIFNSLNSIQDLILKGNVEHSYSYITTFSNMVRRTLDYSDKDFIDFEEEIQLLELYLSLEKLRFKKDFEFSINIKNVEDVMLPPLLIQPFIENALAHGLLHKDGLKKLNITFELNEHLVCTIEDNGIGRDRSKAIQQRQRADHQSFSGKAIKHRFEILSEIHEGEFDYNYEDRNEEDGPGGTKVVLRIPVKRKY